MRLKIKIAAFFILFSIRGMAQDAQLSQYYNIPVYINPAFAGTVNNSRAVVDYRRQWTALPSPFVTYTATFDHYIAPYNSGVGMIVQRDGQGDGRLNSTSVDLMYNYHVWLSDKWTFIPAVQLGFSNRSINNSGLLFGDQIGSNGATGAASVDNLANGPSKFYPNVGGGGLLYTDRFWLGFSGQHLNKPNTAFFGNFNLPIKTSIHGGYKIFLEKQSKLPKKYLGHVKERSIMPTFLYKSQGGFKQLDLGIYTLYEPLMVGMWYRGIPMSKLKDNITNSEALIFLVGVYHEGFTLAYSYDLTISAFRPGSGGAHEILLSYQWEIPYNNYKIKKHPRKVACPSFYR